MIQEMDYTHALVAPGQGIKKDRKSPMGRDLANASTAAAQVWETADNVLQPLLGNRLTDFVWNRLENNDNRRPDVLQPAIIVDSMARRAALQEMNELGFPGWHAGNSLGFITALVNSGALSVSEAVKLAEGRGEAFKIVFEAGPKTVMMALKELDREFVDEIAGDYDLELCLINTEKQVVLGGRIENVDRAVKYIEEEHKLTDNVVKLEVDGAFHSRFMKPAIPYYQSVVDGIEITTPENGRVVGASTVQVLETPEAIKKELVLQLTTTENWKGVTDLLTSNGVTQITEVASAPTLTAMHRQLHGGVSRQIKLTAGDMQVPVGYRWRAPESAIVVNQSKESTESVPLSEISDWYNAWLSDRSGWAKDEITSETTFEEMSLDSSDAGALRAAVRARFGRNVSDEEAAKILSVGAAINSTFRLLNG